MRAHFHQRSVLAPFPRIAGTARGRLAEPSRGRQCHASLAFSLRNRFIGQTLADHTLQQKVRTLHVIDAQRLAVGEAEIELVHVALQMRLADMVIGAVNAALQDRKVRLWSARERP